MDKKPVYLPSLFQYAELDIWQPRLFWVKIDFSQAYFNITVNRKLRKYLSFKVNNRTYRFKVLPFGLGVAPWVCQQFMDAILKWIKKYTPHTSGHIDDLLIGHPDRIKLAAIVRKLVKKLVKAGWIPNPEKSNFKPATEVVFLNAEWNQTGVTRLAADSLELRSRIAQYDPLNTSPKEKERLHGYLVYYLRYFGYSHPLVQRFLKGEDLKQVLLHMAEFDTILFSWKKKSDLVVYTDATEVKLAAIVGSEVLTHELSLPRPIIMTELDALLMGIERALTVSSKGLPRLFKPEVKVFTDSKVALWFVRKGTARYSWSTSDLTTRILRWNALRRLICVDCEYVKSEENPADYYSRY
jgi:hypothetical protein